LITWRYEKWIHIYLEIWSLENWIETLLVIRSKI
jgi:hypothetical protein